MPGESLKQHWLPEALMGPALLGAHEVSVSQELEEGGKPLPLSDQEGMKPVTSK